MTELPKIFSAGETLEWSEDITDYSAADGYTLKYALRGPGKVDLISSADGSSHSFEKAYTNTKAYTPGNYSWTKYVDYSGGRHVIGHGTTVIRPNLILQNEGYDGRSDARQIYDSLVAAYKSIGSKTTTEISWPNGARVKYQRAELTDEIKRWANIVAEEQAELDLEMGNEVAGNFTFGFGS